VSEFLHHLSGQRMVDVDPEFDPPAVLRVESTAKGRDKRVNPDEVVLERAECCGFVHLCELPVKTALSPIVLPGTALADIVPGKPSV
jgi:hypothetical protein